MHLDSSYRLQPISVPTTNPALYHPSIYLFTRRLYLALLTLTLTLTLLPLCPH
jgi:hypothetical protein